MYLERYHKRLNFNCYKTGDVALIVIPCLKMDIVILGQRILRYALAQVRNLFATMTLLRTHSNAMQRVSLSI